MSIDLIHLNKLLRLFYMPDNELISELRTDIRTEIKKESGYSDSGGHFYTPFWSDVKLHVLGQADLTELTADRIKVDTKKSKLYPLLRDGFLDLWQRGSNQRVKLIDKSPKDRYEAIADELTIKVENIMAITINGNERLGYPYWFPNPVLSREAARVGLWVITKTLKDQNANNVRIFDIIRSNFYSLENSPLQGDEEKILLDNFSRISKLRKKLKAEY
jgi:hypothetical protein